MMIFEYWIINYVRKIKIMDFNESMESYKETFLK